MIELFAFASWTALAGAAGMYAEQRGRNGFGGASSALYSRRSSPSRSC